MSDPVWTALEVGDHGRMKITNGEVTVEINADFSGALTSEVSGDYFEFPDLRDLITGAKLLEQVLVERYGGWK